MISATRKWLSLAAVLLLGATVTRADNAEQVIFSTPGFLMDLAGNTTAPETPFGYWVWCAADAAPTSRGGYQNANACQGSMYFYLLDKHAASVIGFVTEDPEGIYTMHVVDGTFAQLKTGSLHPTFSCTLTNVTPDPKGPGNQVHVDCEFAPSLGGGTGSSLVLNSVANVTGP